MHEAKCPKRLYKYRSFNSLTLSMLVDDVVYFADPSTFNDPLDTRPTLSADLETDALEGILYQLVVQRTMAEMLAAAKTMKYRGPKTQGHIVRHSQKMAEQLLADVRYNATAPHCGPISAAKHLLSQYVQEELLRRYDKGVFSLAERVSCPLMWSHYGDQHRGLCLGYSVPEDTVHSTHKIRYGGSRLVRASAVSAMLDGSEAAREEVDSAVLLKKAKSWSYEREWRVIGPRYQQDSPLELEEVVFGMRCPDSVKYTIFKALEQRDRPVRFYEMRERPDSFLIQKRSIDNDEWAMSFPRRCRLLDDVFEDLTKVQ